MKYIVGTWILFVRVCQESGRNVFSCKIDFMTSSLDGFWRNTSLDTDCPVKSTIVQISSPLGMPLPMSSLPDCRCFLSLTMDVASWLVPPISSAHRGWPGRVIGHLMITRPLGLEAPWVDCISAH